MNLQEYIDARPQKTIKADIRERWNSRIMPRNLQLQGEAGAQAYLRDYGKSIAAPKCLQFGALALENGLPEFAAGFYKKAAELEGVELSDAGNPNNGARLSMADRALAGMTPSHVEPLNIPGFPEHMQPGRLSPMQPTDAEWDQEFYIRNPNMWGQPKIDGQKLIVFATQDQVWYQSRQLKLNGTPDPQMDADLKSLARSLGNFVLEGELTFYDVNGKEHRTGSQAATANAEAGLPGAHVQMRFIVFSCLWCQYGHMSTYGEMVGMGRQIAQVARSECIEPIFTARTHDERASLVARQQSEGREGEVWFDPNTPYLAGKHKDGRFVRTKYLTEFEAIVVGFTPTTAAGHAFGAMIIENEGGTPLGNVGTGFTREDKVQLLRKFQAAGPFKVEIRCQGFTEGPEPKAWHARFLRIVE